MLFQLTRSRGAWRNVDFGNFCKINFNSHAHVERDCINSDDWKRQCISTHTLTWSVTCKAVTSCWRTNNFNSHAHVERDSCKVPFPATLIDISTHTLTWSVTLNKLIHAFTVKFQLTRSRGAWPNSLMMQEHIRSFQLTRSRGAWLYTSVNCFPCSNFNSHAHVERDARRLPVVEEQIISTHTLTWSVTGRKWKNCTWIYISTHTLTWSVTLEFQT